MAQVPDKVNIHGYAYFEGRPTHRTRHKLEVSFILDMVRGPWHQPEDIMNWMCLNSYVDTVSYVEPTEKGLNIPLSKIQEMITVLNKYPSTGNNIVVGYLETLMENQNVDTPK